MKALIDKEVVEMMFGIISPTESSRELLHLISSKRIIPFLASNQSDIVNKLVSANVRSRMPVRSFMTSFSIVSYGNSLSDLIDTAMKEGIEAIIAEDKGAYQNPIIKVCIAKEIISLFQEVKAN